MKLSIVVASTRPGRVGLPIAQWFHARAKEHGKLDADLVDLKEMDLPIFDEPKHPRLQQYEHEHTKRWSAIVKASDAFVFVSPEYNYTTPPALVNALNFLYHEWSYKPAGLVSYGGVSGGLRGAQCTRLMLNAFKVVPVTEAVAIPFFTHHMKDGVFEGTEPLAKSAHAMLDELAKWTPALKTLRS
jgi:NAD(P)H-dependent FMN reductase